MARLRNKYLSVLVEAVLHPPSPAASEAVSTAQQAATATRGPVAEELTAEQWLERAFVSGDTETQILYYTEAIRLSPITRTLSTAGGLLGKPRVTWTERSLITTRPFDSIGMTRTLSTTAALLGKSEATWTGRSLITTRPFDSIP